MIPVEWTYHRRIRFGSRRQLHPSAQSSYEELVPTDLARLLSHHILTPDTLSPPVRDLFDSLGGVEEVQEVHVFPNRGDDGLDQVWVVATQVTPETIRAITDSISEVELCYELIYDIRVVSKETGVPLNARASLVKG